MNNLFLLKEGKSAIITDEYFAISKKRINSFDDFKKKAEMIAYKDEFLVIEKRHIHKVNFNKEGVKIKINFASKTNVNDKVILTLNDSNDLNGLGSDLESKLFLVKREKVENKLALFAKKSLNLLIILVCTVSLAFIVHSSDDVNFSGRRAGLKELLFDIADFIGPVGVVIIGLIVMFFVGRKTIKRLKSPAKELVFTKK